MQQKEDCKGLCQKKGKKRDDADVRNTQMSLLDGKTTHNCCGQFLERNRERDRKRKREGGGTDRGTDNETEREKKSMTETEREIDKARYPQ